MNSVEEDLLGEFTPQQSVRSVAPAARGRQMKAARSPQESLEVLDQMIAAQVGFEVPVQEIDLLDQG